MGVGIKRFVRLTSMMPSFILTTEKINKEFIIVNLEKILLFFADAKLNALINLTKILLKNCSASDLSALAKISFFAFFLSLKEAMTASKQMDKPSKEIIREGVIQSVIGLPTPPKKTRKKFSRSTATKSFKNTQTNK